MLITVLSVLASVAGAIAQQCTCFAASPNTNPNSCTSGGAWQQQGTAAAVFPVGTRPQVCIQPSAAGSAPSFQLGVNIPWHNCGWDFHAHYQWGDGFDRRYWQTVFKDLAEAGATVARFWVFGDGRSVPLQQNNVPYLDEEFFTKFDEVLSLARAYGIAVLPVLWDHNALGDQRECCGELAGNRHNLFLEPAAYFENVLIPLVSRFKGDRTILAWEVMNEPEFAMVGTGKHYMRNSIDAHRMLRFMIHSAYYIHVYGDRPVTVGAAHPDTLWWWTDETWVKHGAWSKEALLDFYQVHVYPWGEQFSFLLPLTLGKPLLIGETPANSGHFMDVCNALRAYESGFYGLLYWSYLGRSDNELGNWTNIKPLLEGFRSVHPL